MIKMNSFPIIHIIIVLYAFALPVIMSRRAAIIVSKIFLFFSIVNQKNKIFYF